MSSQLVLKRRGADAEMKLTSPSLSLTRLKPASNNPLTPASLELNLIKSDCIRPVVECC